jgi:hypothetical protein
MALRLHIFFKLEMDAFRVNAKTRVNSPALRSDKWDGDTSPEIRLRMMMAAD